MKKLFGCLPRRNRKPEGANPTVVIDRFEPPSWTATSAAEGNHWVVIADAAFALSGRVSHGKQL